MLRANLRALLHEWNRRAEAAERGRMPQIAADYRDCSEELLRVVRGQRL
jgi:hypothetical protein